MPKQSRTVLVAITFEFDPDDWGHPPPQFPTDQAIASILENSTAREALGDGSNCDVTMKLVNELHVSLYTHRHGTGVNVHISEEHAHMCLANVAFDNTDELYPSGKRARLFDMVAAYRDGNYYEVVREYNEANRADENMETQRVNAAEAAKPPQTLSNSELQSYLDE